MVRFVFFLLTIFACHMLPAQAQNPEQDYTPPQLWSGTLYLSTTSELSPTQSEILQAELDRTNNTGELVGIGSAEQCEQSAVWKLLSQRSWAQSPRTIGSSNWKEETSARLQQLKRGGCLWIDDRALAEITAADRGPRAALLRGCLDRGVLVILDCAHTQDNSPLANGWNLLPDIDLVRNDDQRLTTESLTPNRLRIRVSKNSWLRIGRRELINLSEPAAAECHCDWPATGTYTEALHEVIANRQMVDLTAARRALSERQQPVFPAARAYHPTLGHGSLVIVGGGGAPAAMWDKFVELAGGKEACIVVLPTAVAEPEYEDDDEVRLLKRHGAGEVRMLRQYQREEVSKEDFLAELRRATGIWFGGGRQWRFVDAYWGTPAWEEIKQVLTRGGVIGGSSAGATIQGDLLVRGSPLGNQIMVADGYRRGLGLLEGVAIDQHFKQRNRFDDLTGVLTRFPTIYGIGIDENTALVVQAPNRCSVLGQGSVWLNPPSSKSREYIQHPSGDEFTLVAP